MYYEVAFIPANDKASKTGRIISFTDIELSDYYAVKFAIANNSIEIFGKTMPIRVIVNWEVNIRPCEYANFAKLIDKNARNLSKAEQQRFSQYLTETGTNLSELLDISDEAFIVLCSRIVPNSNSNFFFDILDYCRDLLRNQSPGANILRYLLFHMTNRIIKAQYKKYWNERNREYTGNFRLSGLYLNYKCIPFDQMPFCSSLRKHVPSISDLFECFDVYGREHEILAWFINHDTEHKGILFTKLEKSDKGKYTLFGFDDVESLVNTYNQRLYHNSTQQARKLIIENGFIFIKDYKEDTVSIIQTVKKMTTNGIPNHLNTAKHWIDTQDNSDLSDEKKDALINLFDKSKVALVYGVAGTVKTTLIVSANQSPKIKKTPRQQSRR